MARGQDVPISQMRKGVVELAVLGLLRDGPRYGSQLVDELAGFPGLAVSVGTIYPLLARLREAGHVTTEWHESPAGPPRKYYFLTPKGREVLSSLIRGWRAITADMAQILRERA